MYLYDQWPLAQRIPHEAFGPVMNFGTPVLNDLIDVSSSRSGMSDIVQPGTLPSTVHQPDTLILPDTADTSIDPDTLVEVNNADTLIDPDSQNEDTIDHDVAILRQIVAGHQGDDMDVIDYIVDGWSVCR